MEVRVEQLAPVREQINVALTVKTVKTATESMKEQYVGRALDVKA